MIIEPLTIKPKEIATNDLNGLNSRSAAINTAVQAPVIGNGMLKKSINPIYPHF